MRLSKYFLPVLKETPSDAAIVSHRLMIRSGMIRQQNSGIYYWLPLGFRVLEKIKNIVRKHLEEADCIELLMPCIQPADLWKESERYDSYGKEMLRMIDRHENSMLFGPTNEEAITDIFRKNIFSYKDLPKNFFHLQWKFRDEIRPRFGVMRGREFLMKDGYSFDLDEQSARQAYKKMYITYLKIFRALGLTPIPVRADTGAIGGDLSHEFHIMADTGESQIYFDKKFNDYLAKDEYDFEELQSLYAAADEMHDENKCNISGDDLLSRRGIEVGHIFYFCNKYTKIMNAKVLGKNGEQIFPECGSYGIGISRLVAAIIESSHDDSGIIWPSSVSPFSASLINLKPSDITATNLANEVYEKLLAVNIEVLYDDSDDSIGTKFATHDLLGFPLQIIVGPKSASQNLVELKNRKTGHKEELSIESLLASLVKNVY
jgi:prolyl-tRNA synthetase